jgi:hypothetical protein
VGHRHSDAQIRGTVREVFMRAVSRSKWSICTAVTFSELVQHRKFIFDLLKIAVFSLTEKSLFVIHKKQCISWIPVGY